MNLKLLERVQRDQRDIVAGVEEMARTAHPGGKVYVLTPLPGEHLQLYEGRVLLARVGDKKNRFVRLPTDRSLLNSKVISFI